MREYLSRKVADEARKGRISASKSDPVAFPDLVPFCRH